MSEDKFSKLKKLMGIDKSIPQGAGQNLSTPEKAQNNSKRSEETYRAYGVRIAGINSGSLQALTPSLQAVILSEKSAQATDKESQLQYKSNLEAQKQKIINSKESLELQIKADQRNITGFEESISEKERSITELKGSKEKDKLANLTFVISTVIVIFLTLYLFLFYSSASYSAIYMSANDSNTSGLANHIFNPQALGLAYEQGFFALLLVLLLPVIFLGLGFLIHQFSQEEGVGKYIKVTCLVGVNFVFDAILAYRISKVTYDLLVASQLSKQPPYTVNMAFQSADFWLVIFAGFIAYIIWGLVFSSMMETYGKLTSNKHLIDAINLEINTLKTKRNELQNKISQTKQEILSLDSKQADIESKIKDGYTVDYDKIKKCLTEFFGGWQSFLNGLGVEDQVKKDAKECFENEIKSLAI